MESNTQNLENKPTNLELYKQLCEQQPDIPLFMQYWWMETVCAGKHWDVLLSYDPDGQIAGAMPYLWGKKIGMKYIIQPQETQINGMWIPKTTNSAMVSHTCDILIGQMAALKFAYYYQQYPIDSMCPNQLQTKGFKVKKRITYRIDDLSDMDKVVASFSKNKKRQLQRALSLHADLDMSAEEFYNFHVACLAEQNKQISYSREFFLVLHRKASDRGQGQIIAIRNADGHTLAAAFVVWDATTAYYLIPCYLPSKKDTGASSLLVLESIKFARSKAAAFDFEGSMIRGVANHYKQFGSTPTTYYSVEKCTNIFFRFLLFGNWLRTWKKR